MAETSFKGPLDNGRALLRDIIKENHKFEMSPVKDLDFFRLIKKIGKMIILKYQYKC